MAFAFVAVTNHAGSASTATITITKPSGTADNDIMVAWIKHNANEAESTVPTGWTNRGELWNAGSSSFFRIYTKVASSEGADYTWTWATAARTGGSIVTYRDGFNTSDPIDVVSNTAYVTSNTILRAAGVTVASTGSPIIFVGGTHSSTSQTFTPPTNPGTFAEDVDFHDTGSRGARTFASLVWGSSGATGDMDATISATTVSKHAFAIVLKPASGGGGPSTPAFRLSLLRAGR